MVRGLTGAEVVERREAVGHGGIAGGWGELNQGFVAGLLVGTYAFPGWIG